MPSTNSLAEGYLVGRARLGHVRRRRTPRPRPRRPPGVERPRPRPTPPITTAPPRASSPPPPCPSARPPARPPPSSPSVSARPTTTTSPPRPGAASSPAAGTARATTSSATATRAATPRLPPAVCDYVNTARGVRCTPDQIVIVTGTQQALASPHKSSSTPVEAAWIEDPGYPARGALVAAGAPHRPRPRRRSRPRRRRRHPRAPPTRASPSSRPRTSPRWASRSAPTAARLLELGAHADAWIFEDDYDSEYRYAGRPLPALQGDERGRRPRASTAARSAGALPVDPPRPTSSCPPLSSTPSSPPRPSPTSSAPPSSRPSWPTSSTGGHFARHIRRMRILYANARPS